MSTDEVEVAEQIADKAEEKPVVKAPEAEKVVEAKWPDNWRELIAGEDEKTLKQLQRYSAPDDVYKKARSLEQKLSSGEYKMSLSESPTDDELKEFRQINGIPETPEGYDLTFDDGRVIGEADKPIIDEFLKESHERHKTPEQVKADIQWYFSLQERQAEEMAQKDAQIMDATEDELRAEFGNNYRRELAITENFLATAPESLRGEIATARLPDGTPLGSHKDFIMWMNHLAREMNPAGMLTGVDGADPGKGLTDRINEIKHIMRTDKARYKREGLDKEFEGLTEKLAKYKARTA